jgi:hypothetical protein
MVTNKQAPPARKIDQELEQFRTLMEVPATFEDGFSWKALFGAIFIALLMVPGAIYMGLLAGQGVGPAAQWVTVILFIEIARRAQSQLKRAEIFVLFYMAGAAMGAPFSGLLWHQFFARSRAAQATGIAEQLPTWYAPAADSEAYGLRTFFHPDWLPAISLIIFGNLVGSLANMVLGYGLFRVTSDIERLPFPMAPVGAQGIMALAEDTGETGTGNWRWRVFAIGGALGLGFGLFYLLLPTVTGALTGSPIQFFTIPFAETSAKTQQLLPAVATGWCWDLGLIILGMVMPFFAVIGGAIGLLATLIANPMLYHSGMLSSWAPGDSTVLTMFKNNIDFYFSFGIGISLAVAVVGIYQVVAGLRKRKQEQDARKEVIASNPADRGDIRPSWIFLCYLVVTAAYICVSGVLIDWHPGVMIVLIALGLIYTPLISYVTARLEGMAGQVVEIPMIREASLIMSGFVGVKVWFLPIPIANYGAMTVFYRQCELTGTKFTSIWKTQLVLFPIILGSSFFFMNFIWGLAEVPSAVYPFAMKMWDLNAANQCVMFSSTLGEYSIFQDAFKPGLLALGFGIGVSLFAGLSWLGAPVFLVYGLVRGLNNAIPHYILPELIGALLGRFYFQKKLGDEWRKYIPVVAAGFACGTGLVTVLGIGITFMSKAVVQLPF